jgi:hypothetical protein
MTKSIAFIIWISVLSVFIWLMLDLIIPYLNFHHEVDFLLTKQKIIHIKHWRYAFYLHVMFSIFSMLAGFTQFSKYIMNNYKKAHRLFGYIYVIDILCLAGPSGLIMSFYANGTIISKTSFVILSLLWIYTTIMALNAAMKKDFPSHEKWMVRSFALTLSAISLRLMALIMPKFIHLEAHDAYALIAWLSWTVNLLIAELIIYRKFIRLT